MSIEACMVFHGDLQAVFDVSLSARDGRTLALITRRAMTDGDTQRIGAPAKASAAPEMSEGVSPSNAYHDGVCRR